jgi:GrpB-like predicted nucleotidyltransferase (UPF0157 family)
MNKIIVEKYNPEWKEEFQIAKTFYMEILKDINCEVVHVGSTSVKGVWAKPILDIDIIVNNSEDCNNVIFLLESVGYTHIGNVGIEGREAFKYSGNNKYIVWMEHNLYVCLKGNENLRNHLLLQKHLQSNKKSADKYSKLKRELAKKYPYDIDSYVDGKTDLINSFLEVEGMSSDELKRIESVNKVK